MKTSKKSALFAPILALVLASQAHAWTYNCVNQSASNHSVNLRVSDDESVGAIVWVRYNVDGATGVTIPVMNPNGKNDFKSPDGDVEVSINAETDDDGTNTINLRIKSLSIKGDIGCTAL